MNFHFSMETHSAPRGVESMEVDINVAIADDTQVVLSEGVTFGTEGDIVSCAHSSRRNLRAFGYVYAQGIEHDFYEWADVTPYIESAPDDYVAQIHRSGAQWRYKKHESDELWTNSWTTQTHPKFASKNTVNPHVPRQRFNIRKTGRLASTWVCLGFFGECPEDRPLALHAERWNDSNNDNPDAVTNVSWGNASENIQDKIEDGTSSRVGVFGTTTYGRPISTTKTTSTGTGKNGKTIALTERRADGYLWAVFISSTDAAKQLGLSQPLVSNTCSGKTESTGGWKFARKTIDISKETLSLLDTSFRGNRYVTSSGKVIQSRSIANGAVEYVNATPGPANGGYTELPNKSGDPVVRAAIMLHRIVVLLHGQAIIEAAERKYSTVFAGLEVNHINGQRSDNRLENLEVVSRADNTKHGHCIAIEELSDGSADASVVGEWQGMAECAKSTSIAEAAIRAVCRGTRANAQGRFFRYRDYIL